MRSRLRGAVLALACVATLASCGGDDVETGTDPVEVKVGTSFSWNGFVVEDGWEVNPIKRSAGAEEMVTPEVRGTIANKVDETRTALFELVFSEGGEQVATVNCSAGEMATDESQQFLCTGLNAEMPEDYDAIVVQEFTRDTTSS